MKHSKSNRVMFSAVVMAATAAAAVSCTSSSTPGKGGDVRSTTSTATRASALIHTGIGQMNRKAWSAAITTFQEVLAISPGNVYANYDLGVVAQSTGNLAGAIVHYNQAARKEFTPAMYNEAILLESSAPQQAIDLYQRIVRINSRASTAYLRMAFVQAKQGDFTDARANDDKAISLDPALAKYPLPAKK